MVAGLLHPAIQSLKRKASCKISENNDELNTHMKRERKIRGYIIRSAAVAVVFSCAIVGFTSAFSLPGTWLGLSSRPGLPIRPAGLATQTKTLTFADRVAYQRVIEEVYWRHRMWPKENAGPKPSLDKVLSHAQIEKKVEDYLRNSQLLADYWQQPITPEQLQAEMERMAKHTKQPEVLRELFAALGNDPLVIAECFARPILSERLVTSLYAYDQRFHGELQRRAEAELEAHRSVSQMKQTSGTYSEVELVRNDNGLDEENRGAEATAKLNSRDWNKNVQKLAAIFGDGNAAAGEPALRDSRTGVSPVMPKLGKGRSPGQHEKAGAIDLNRLGGSGEPSLPQKGAPITQIKTGVLSSLQEDEGHYYATAVISKAKDRLRLATIAWTKEPFDSWRAEAETHMPRTMAAAITAKYTLPTIGGPSVDCADSWIATSTTNAPAIRFGHAAVWTGSEMIVWGGYDGTYLNTGARYNPSTDSWTATSTGPNAPTVRAAPTAVWTGSEMIVWGGFDGSAWLNTGRRYNPGTDSWTATNTTNAPTGRTAHTAVWTGSEMIVWGGFDGTNVLNTGGRYNPGMDSWVATSTANAPPARAYHTAVWTGSEMIVWGGFDGTNVLNTGRRYNPSTNSWTTTTATNAPAARAIHTGVWTGSEMIVWGGFGGTIDVSSGARYDPTTDTWTATGVTSAVDAREAHTAVWSGTEMIVWGGVQNGTVLNTGGRYSPSTDSWTVTSVTNAPEARGFHTAVWTGNEMIVWGGESGTEYFNTGGRYCASIHPAFFSGEVSLGNGVYYLQFPNGTPFGYYAYLTDQNFIYHFDLGFEYLFDANDANHGIFFYDFMSNHFFYTSPSFPFPYLYDFSLNTVLYYYPDPNNPGHYTTNPRYFYNFATGQIITM